MLEKQKKILNEGMFHSYFFKSVAPAEDDQPTKHEQIHVESHFQQ